MTSIEPEKKLLTNRKLLAVFFVQLNEAYQISVLLPIVVFMCRDFGIASQWLGVYTSILNASFGFCQFLVSYLWGYMSDIYGRRNILIFGLLGTFASMTVFGFSTSFWMAMISRCMTGFFNGNLGVVKAYLADITDSSNRGYAFSIIGVSFGAGIIMGSMLGGILIETNEVDVPNNEYIKTTSILKWWIFESQFPFLLPTAVCGSIISINALFWTLFFIKDVERNFHRSTPKIKDNESVVSIDVEMASTYSNDNDYSNGCTSYHKNEYLAMNQSLPTHHEMKAMMTTFETDRLKLLGNVRESKAVDDFEEIDIYSLKKASDLFKYTKLGHALLQYGIAAISHMMFKEMGPVFMAQALEFNSTFIGYTQAFSGGILLIFCIWIQPLCLKVFRHKIMAPICAIATAMCMILMPSIYWFTLTPNENSFVTKPWWLLVMVFVVEFIITCTVSIVFVVATCWVNNSVPNIHVGKANGIGQTMASFVRGFGPLLTGFIWSESFTQIESGEANYAVYYAYLPGAIFYFIMVIDIIIYIPSNLQYTWEQREQNKSDDRLVRG